MRRALVLSLVLAGCGDKLHHGIDAPPIDAATDTIGPTTGDPPANAVTLVITRGGVPVFGVAVIFQAADSSLVHASLTNEQGLSWAVMPSGGFVTAIERVGNGLDELTTFAAVQEADALVLAHDPTGDKTEWPIAMSIPTDTNAAGYQVYTSCGGPFGIAAAQPTDVMLIGCNGVADVVVMSQDETNQPLRAFYTPDVTIPASPPPPTAYPSVDITGTYAALATASFSYTNVPASISWLGTYHALANSHGRTFAQTTGADVTTGTATSSVLLPAAAAASLTVTTTFGSDPGQQLVYQGRASATDTYQLDVGAALLPTYTTVPAFDAATRTVTWTEGSAAVQPDLVRTRIHVYRDDVPSGRAWGWRMIAPRTGASVTYPRLPVFGFDFNPTSTDVAGVDELTCADVPGDYAAARRIGFGDFTSLVIGTTHRMTVQLLAMMEL